MRAFISVLLPLPCRSKPDCLEVAPGKTCGAMYGTKPWPCAPFGQETHGFNLNVATRVIAGVTTPVTRPPEGGVHAGVAQFAGADGLLAARCSRS